MSSRGAISTAAAATLGLALAGALWAGTYVYQMGAVTVRVIEKQPDGERVHLWVPGVLAAVGIKFVPDEHLGGIPPDARRFLPAVRIACEELRKVPDGPLVEVTSPQERVSIVKQGGALVVDVDNESESVHVSVPLKLAASLVDDLEQAAAAKALEAVPAD